MKSYKEFQLQSNRVGDMLHLEFSVAQHEATRGLEEWEFFIYDHQKQIMTTPHIWRARVFGMTVYEKRESKIIFY